MPFIGRTDELQNLENLYGNRQANLIVIYGRRRVGKSTLIEKFIAKKTNLAFEGLEKTSTKNQIKQFTNELSLQINEPLLKHASFQDWTAIFEYLTKYFESLKEKCILFLDEFQWLAVNQSKLVSLVKYYWDKHWSKQKVMLILCGSVSSYMIKRVICSKALYGRINWELCLQPLQPNEIFQMLDGKRSQDEALLYAMIVGGIPKYLKEINSNQSFDQNMNKLFFSTNGIFVNEYHRIFFSQFKEHKTYEAIVHSLRNNPLSLDDIAKAIKFTSGGGLKLYLENLEKSSFITSYVPYNKSVNSKLIRYKLTDEYIRFYCKYIEPHIKLINTNPSKNLFSRLVKPVWQSWLGFAFENFCLKNAFYLTEIMGFSDQVLNWGPLFHQKDKGFQIDLVYVRQDNVITVCELKYSSTPIGVDIIREMDRKCSLITIPHGFTLEKALISRFGADASLTSLGYFNHIISGEDFFK